jgi:hypothetical protein
LQFGRIGRDCQGEVVIERNGEDNLMKINYDKQTDTLDIVFTEMSIAKSNTNILGIIMNYGEKGNLVSLRIISILKRAEKVIVTLVEEIFTLAEGMFNIIRGLFQKKLNRPLFIRANAIKNRYRSLSTVDEQNKKVEQFNLNHLFVQIAQVNLRRSRTYGIIDALAYLGMLVLLILLPGINDASTLHPKIWKLAPLEIMKLLFNDFTNIGDSLIWIFQFQTIIYTVTLAYVYALIFNRLIRLLVPRKLAYFPNFMMTAILLWFYSSRQADSIYINLFFIHLEIPLLALLYSIAVNLFLFLLILLTNFSKFFLDRTFKSNHPDAFIVSKTIETLEKLEKGGKLWLNIDNRRDLMLLFEEVAQCIENQLYKKLQPNDIYIDNWFRKATKEIAAAIRAKKALVLIPNLDTPQLLSTYFKSILIAVARGNWENIERVEPGQAPLRVVWYDRIANLLMALATGGTPILLLYLVQKTDLALTSPLLDYATAGAILWALFTLITAFDPSFNLKLEALKGIAGLFPFGGNR